MQSRRGRDAGARTPGWSGDRRGRVRVGVIACAVIGASCLGFGCSREEPQPREALVRPVKTMIVAVGENARTRTLPGRVEVANKVVLAFQVSGVLVNLPVKEGQRVAQGDIIAQLRTSEFEARVKTLDGQLAQARATLDALRLGERPEEQLRRESQVRAAEARLANAKAEFERMANLVVTNAVSRLEYERSETSYRVAQEELETALQLRDKGMTGRDEEIAGQEAAVRALEGRMAEATVQLEDATLRAPYDGVVSQVLVRQNQSIRASDGAVRFQGLEEIDIALDVPEALMASDIRTADFVEMVAEFSGVPGREFPVRIREVSQSADPITQTFTVRVSMAAPEGVTLLPGMSATVRMSVREPAERSDRILVPISAVYKDPSGEQVAWIIGPDGSVQRRPVRLGEATGAAIEVVEGLSAGDRIAVAGVTFLREGMKVRDLGDALGSSRP